MAAHKWKRFEKPRNESDDKCFPNDVIVVPWYIEWLPSAASRNHRRSGNKLWKINFSFAILAKFASLFAGFSIWQTNYAGHKSGGLQQYKPFVCTARKLDSINIAAQFLCAASYCLCVCRSSNVYMSFLTFTLSICLIGLIDVA